MKKLGFIIGIIVFLSSCAGSGNQSDKEEASDTPTIEQLEDELFGSNQSKIDRKKAIDLINLYIQYVDENPEDSLAPEYLYKASDISMNMQRPTQTIELFDMLLDRYPDYEKTPTALFLKAFVYEDQLKDYDKAKMYYELFLEKYPDNEFADDAEISLQNLGKTPEELIKEFEEQAQ